MRGKSGISDKTRAGLLVAAQFGAIVVLLLTTRLSWQGPGLVFIVLALLVLSWAILAMRRSRLRVTPIPGENARLVEEGPYQYIRHPMYTSVLLGALGLLIMDFSGLRLVVVGFLVVVLILKLEFEERLLSEKFSGYANYKRRTRKLIPLLY